MKTIAIGTMKGGTGKTTLAFNLGWMLAENHRVLFWDLDPQSNLSQSVGLNINSRGYNTTKDVFDTPQIDPADIVVDISENVSIMPGDIDLTMTEATLPSRAAKELILRNYINRNAGYFNQFDYIIFDTNPSMGSVNQNGFVCANSIVLISDVSLHSIRGAELFMYLWAEIRDSLGLPDTIKALVLNNYDARTNLAKDTVSLCQGKTELAPLLIDTVVPSRTALKHTTIQHKPISVLQPNSDTTEILQKVINELEQKGVF